MLQVYKSPVLLQYELTCTSTIQRNNNFKLYNVTRINHSSPKKTTFTKRVEFQIRNSNSFNSERYSLIYKTYLGL